MKLTKISLRRIIIAKMMVLGLIGVIGQENAYMMPKDNNNQMPESMYISSIQDNYLANFSPSIAEPDGTYYALRHHAYQK